jgi:FtsP/CotA-like multicopper oxidase with cupredoxin domain
LKDSAEISSSVEKFKAYQSAKPDYEFELTLEQNAMRGMGMPPAVSPIEWEETGHDAMMNRMSTSDNVKWIIRDMKTGKENRDINYRVRLGNVKKIRLFNNPKSMHPMQHPMHLHGQRFLVLGSDGAANQNLVWKDTVLVPAGKTIDILADFSNPGEWMMHCHIAEHLEAGMMAMFTVS